MTSGRVHGRDARLFNYDNKVNEIIDLPFMWLGNKHRILFHTPEEAFLIGYIIDGTNGAIGGLRHLMLDQITDKDTKEALELMAILSPIPKKPKKGHFYVKMDLENLKKEGVDSHEKNNDETISVSVATPSKEEIEREAIERLIKSIIRFTFS